MAHIFVAYTNPLFHIPSLLLAIFFIYANPTINSSLQVSQNTIIPLRRDIVYKATASYIASFI